MTQRVPNSLLIAGAKLEGVEDPVEVARVEAEIAELEREIASRVTCDGQPVPLDQALAWVRSDEGRAWLEAKVAEA